VCPLVSLRLQSCMTYWVKANNRPRKLPSVACSCVIVVLSPRRVFLLKDVPRPCDYLEFGTELVSVCPYSGIPHWKVQELFAVSSAHPSKTGGSSLDIRMSFRVLSPSYVVDGES
jgi:hypothetical protein